MRQIIWILKNFRLIVSTENFQSSYILYTPVVHLAQLFFVQNIQFDFLEMSIEMNYFIV